MTHMITEPLEVLDGSQPTSPRPEDFRLVRIDQDEIEAAWSMIKQSMVGALPVRIPKTESTFAGILASIKARGIIPWVVRTESDIYAIMTTIKRVDDTTGHYFLNIYTLYAMPDKVMTLDVWVDCFKKLSKYATSIGCVSVILETANEEVAHLAKRICPEADIETRIINMPLVEED